MNNWAKELRIEDSVWHPIYGFGYVKDIRDDGFTVNFRGLRKVYSTIGDEITSHYPPEERKYASHPVIFRRPQDAIEFYAQRYVKFVPSPEFPSFKNAPDWADWVAQDLDGTWCWYELEPNIDEQHQCWTSVCFTKSQNVDGYAFSVMRMNKHWKTTLMERP